MSKYRLHPAWLPPQTENAQEIFRTILNPHRLPKTENGNRIKELTVSGSYGNGKSMLIASAIHIACMRNPGLRVMFVRQELSSLNGVLLPQFSEKVLKYGFMSSRNNPIYKTRGGSIEPNRWDYRNGSRVVTAGLDRPSKRLGGEYDIIWVNQSEQVSAEAWMKLASRLRGAGWLARDGSEKYLLIGDANPGPPTHFLKMRADRGRTPMMSMSHQDNPGYYYNGAWTTSGAEYIATLQNSLEGFEYERGFLGKWVAASGLVYPRFSPDVHVHRVMFRDIPSNWTWNGSIDYGFSHAGVYTLFASSPDRGDARRHIAFKTVYKAEMTVADLYREIMQLHRRFNVKPKWIVADHRSDSNEELIRKGLPILNAKKDVLEGVDSVKRALNRPDGIIFNSKLLSHKPCPRLSELGCLTDPLQEFQVYCYPPEEKRRGDARVDDKPQKGNDDFCDTVRYYLAEFKEYVPYVPIGASKVMPTALPNYVR